MAEQTVETIISGSESKDHEIILSNYYDLISLL